MKSLVASLTSCCFGAALALSYAQGKVDGGIKQWHGLSDSELQKVRDRLPCLKAGMTIKEVWELIGVNVPEREAYPAESSGSRSSRWTVYQLAVASNEHGYNLVVVTDREGKFKRAEIACWTEPKNRCAEDNEEAERNPKECPHDSKR